MPMQRGGTRLGSARLGLVLAVAAWGLGAAPGASAAPAPETLTVTTTEDRKLSENLNYCTGEGPGGTECPLRAAVETAAENSTRGATEVVISVPAGTYVLTKGVLKLGNASLHGCHETTCPVILRGAGAAATVIEAGAPQGIIQTVKSAALITIIGVKLTGGAGTEGAGLDAAFGEGVVLEDDAITLNDDGGVTVLFDDVTAIDTLIAENQAPSGGGVSANHGGFTAVRSTISANTAINAGGGISVATATAELVDSTVTGNKVPSGEGAPESGGAIAAGGGGSLVTLRYSTVTGNTAPSVGGLFGGESVALEGSILSGDSGSECTGAKKATTAVANILFGASACTFTGPVPLGLDPRLGAPSSAFGGRPVIGLLRGSPAFNAGGASCPGAGSGGAPLDERGMSRPQGPGCDLGAVEAGTDAGVTLAVAPEPVTVGSTQTLTAQALNAGVEPLTGVALTVPLPAGTSFISAPAGCTVAIASNTIVTCQVGSLSPGQTAAVAIGIHPEHTGALLETATVTADQPDDNPGNDSATLASVVAGGAAPGGPRGPGASGAAVSALLGRLLVDSHGRVTVRLSCRAPSGASCVNTIGLFARAGKLPASIAIAHGGAGAVLLARGQVTVAAGRTATVRLNLTTAGLKLLRRHRQLTARLLLRQRNPGAATVTHAYAVTIKRHGR